MDFVTSHFGKMKLWPVEHRLNTFSTYLSSKLDSPSPMFWLEENLILSNVLIKEESILYILNGNYFTWTGQGWQWQACLRVVLDLRLWLLRSVEWLSTETNFSKQYLPKMVKTKVVKATDTTTMTRTKASTSISSCNYFLYLCDWLEDIGF